MSPLARNRCDENWPHPRDEIVATMERIDRSRMTTLSRNLSIHEDNGDAVVVGCGVLNAFDHREVLEATAEPMIDRHSFGPLAPLPDAGIDDLCRSFFESTPPASRR